MLVRDAGDRASLRGCGENRCSRVPVRGAVPHARCRAKLTSFFPVARRPTLAGGLSGPGRSRARFLGPTGACCVPPTVRRSSGLHCLRSSQGARCRQACTGARSSTTRGPLPGGTDCSAHHARCPTARAGAPQPATSAACGCPAHEVLRRRCPAHEARHASAAVGPAPSRRRRSGCACRGRRPSNGPVPEAPERRRARRVQLANTNRPDVGRRWARTTARRVGQALRRV